MDKEKQAPTFPVGLTVAAVGAATLCLVGGVSVLAVGLKAAAGGLAWYSCRVAARDLDRLKAAQAAAAGQPTSAAQQRWHALALECLSAAIGAAVFVLVSPALALWVLPGVVIGMVVYNYLRQRQREKLQSMLATEPGGAAPVTAPSA